MDNLESGDSPQTAQESVSEIRARAEQLKESALVLLGRACYECVNAETNPVWSPEATAAVAVTAAECMLRAHFIFVRFLKPPEIITDSTSKNARGNGGGAWEVSRSASFQTTLSLLKNQDNMLASYGTALINGLEFCESVIFGTDRSDFLAGKILGFLVEVLEPVAQLIFGTSGLVYSQRWEPSILDDGILEIGIFTAGIEINSQLRNTLGPNSEEASKEWKALYEKARD